MVGKMGRVTEVRYEDDGHTLYFGSTAELYHLIARRQQSNTIEGCTSYVSGPKEEIEQWIAANKDFEVGVLIRGGESVASFSLLEKIGLVLKNG